jgi:hypothetical protein
LAITYSIGELIARIVPHVAPPNAARTAQARRPYREKKQAGIFIPACLNEAKLIQPHA